MGPTKILVVEDEGIVAADIENSLLDLGYAVSAITNSGERAIEKARELLPDLVLMDIMLMGKLDGIDAGEHIRTHFDIPVVYLTAYSDRVTLQRAKLTEPFGYILKPFEARELAPTIEIALYRHQLEVAMRRVLDKEKELKTLKSCFVSTIADEFRSQLCSISASTELLERDNKLLADRIKADVERLYQLLERLGFLLL